jgi:hypothetical protein
VDVIAVADGQIRSGREYYDLYSLLAQVGGSFALDQPTTGDGEGRR